MKTLTQILVSVLVCSGFLAHAQKSSTTLNGYSLSCGITIKGKKNPTPISGIVVNDHLEASFTSPDGGTAQAHYTPSAPQTGVILMLNVDGVLAQIGAPISLEPLNEKWEIGHTAPLLMSSDKYVSVIECQVTRNKTAGTGVAPIND